MLDFLNVSVLRGGRAVLDSISLRINARERVGIVGPNGAGKTTLFELIAGGLQPDAGDVQVSRGLRLGYLRQKGGEAGDDRTVLSHAEDALPAVRAIEAEIDRIEAGLTNGSGEADARALRRLGELQSELEHQGGYELQGRAAGALGGLGFRAEDLRRPLREFSGGWRMRAELARALVAQPDLLLLDEPTNYLDLTAVEWLQRHLRDFGGTLLLISHDRFLLNTLVSVTVEIAGGRAERYEGNYAAYVDLRRQRREQAEATAEARARRREEIERFVDRFRYKATKAAQVQSRLKMLDRMEPAEALATQPRAASFRIPAPPPCGAEVMRMEDAGASYDGETFVLRHIDLRVMRGDRIALVGYNGLGKTTLLRMMAGRLELREGRRTTGHKVVPGYQAQDFTELLDPGRTVFETVKAAAPNLSDRAARTLLGGFLFGGDAVEKKVGVLSGGETMRLAFARLMANPPNFLLLDEPTTHLDIAAREALEHALLGFAGTLCFVSHDIEFVRRVASTVIALTPPGITPYAGGYDYYHEKSAGEARLIAAPEVADAPAGGAGKTARRDRALRREEVRRQRLPLLKAARDAEAQIGKLELEQADLLSRFGDPASLNYAAANRRLGELRAELALAMDDWESAGLALQALDDDTGA